MVHHASPVASGARPAAWEDVVCLGRSLIPCGLDKRPFVTWKPYQDRLPRPEELAAWQARKPPCWACITGTISKVITLDFDGLEGQDRLRDVGVAPHRVTPSGGHHADFIHPGWPVKTLNAKSDFELRRRFPGLDIRGDGGYACVWGRIWVPEAREYRAYRWLRSAEPYPLDAIPDGMRDFFGLDHAPVEKIEPVRAQAPTFSPNLERWIEHALALAAARGRNNAGFWLATQLRDDGLDFGTAASVMTHYASRTAGTNLKGQREPYTRGEAWTSLRSAYARPARAAARRLP
jgi:hypothetical protein